MADNHKFSIDYQLCRQCGGRCCQGHPGLWTKPEQFINDYFREKPLSRSDMESRLTDLKLTLRDLDGILIPAPQATSTGCIFLGNDGCTLPEQKRPDQCRALQPSLDTLLDDAIHCSLPPEFGSGNARSRWQEFWANE